MPKRVLEITLRSDLGGGPQHLKDLLQGLVSSQELELFVAAPDQEPFGKYFRSWGKKYFRLKHRSFSIALAFRLLLFCRQHNIDIIHSHGRGAGVYARFLKIFGFSVVHTFHGVHRESSFVGQLKFYFDRTLSFFCDAFIFVSEDEMGKALDAGIVTKNQNCHVIMNGVPIPLKPKLGEAQKPALVFSLGRDDKAKGMDIFFEYAKAFQREFPGRAQFLGAGPGLAHKYSSSEGIICLGALQKEKVQEYLQSSSIYLSCSRSEGMPLVVLEALSFGCLALLSEIPGHTYFIQAGVAKGFQNSSYESFKTQLVAALNSPNFVDLKAREFIVRNHSIEHMCQQTKLVYLSF